MSQGYSHGARTSGLKFAGTLCSIPGLAALALSFCHSSKTRMIKEGLVLVFPGSIFGCPDARSRSAKIFAYFCSTRLLIEHSAPRVYQTRSTIHLVGKMAAQVVDTQNSKREKGLSDELALVELSELTTAQLLSAIAESARTAFRARRAVAWAYVPSLRRFTVEQGPSNVEVVMATPAEASYLMGRGVIWRNELSVVQQELAVRSFGLDWSNDAGRIVSLPLRTERTSSLLLCLVEGESEAAELLAGSTLFLRQSKALIANHFSLQVIRTHEAQLAALYEAAIAITSELDLDSVLASIIEHARKLVGTPISYIMLVDSEGTRVSTRATVGTWSHQFSSLVLDLGVGLGGRTAKEIRPLYTKDYLNDTHFRHDQVVDEAVRLEGIKSILGVPLSTQGKLVGVLYVADQMERVFTESDVEILSQLAQHATLAVKNATLYRSLASAVGELQRYQQVTEAQCRRLETADRLNRHLIDVVLSGGGVEAITRQLAVFTETDVVVVDSDLCLLAWAVAGGEVHGTDTVGTGTSPFHDRVVSLLAWLEKSCQCSPGPTENAVSTILRAASALDTTGCVVAPLATGGVVYGWICLLGDPTVLRNQEPLLQVAGQAVTLELVHAQTIAHVEERARRDFLEDLMIHGSDDDALLRRGNELGIDLSQPHCLAVVALENRNATATGDSRRTQSPENPSVERGRLVRDLAVMAPSVFAGQLGDLVVVLLGKHSSKSPIASLKEVLRRRSKPVFAYRGVVTPYLERVEAYGPAFSDARRALPLVPVDTGVGVMDLSSAGILPLLFHGGGAAALRKYVEQTLGPLLGYDARHGGELVLTLAAYLEAGFSPARTAERLHTHVNTVYYRLRKIEALLGPDSLEPCRLAEHQIALLARQVLDAAEQEF